MNALQRVALGKIEKLAENKMLTREEYALLVEVLEDSSHLWTHRILGIEAVDFEHFWELMNISQKHGPDKEPFIHADEYRKKWDYLYGFAY